MQLCAAHKSQSAQRRFALGLGLTSLELATAEKAGERIAGQLCRNASGLYVNCNDASATPESKRELRKQERQQESDTERRANQDKVAREAGLPQNQAEALIDFADPDEPQNLSEENAAALLDAGLVEQNPDGSYRISSAGRSYVTAARSGDVSRARDALGRGGSRQQQAGTRAARAEQRRQEREQKRREREAARTARQQAQAKKPKKGGGGGGKGNDAQAERRRQIAERRARQARIWRDVLANLTPDQQAALGPALAPAATKAARSGFQVFKGSDGQWWWIAVSSTAFEDRDEEIVSVKALAADCDRADQDGDYGPLRWWHLPGVDIGDCRFNAMSGRSLVEMGTFRHPAIARAAAAAAPGLELSIGFKHLPDEPVALGPGQPRVYTYIRRFERSLTPKGRASNLLTAFAVTHKETAMDQAKVKAALEKLGSSPEARAVMQQIISEAQTREKQAEEAGLVFKDAPAWAQALAARLDALEGKGEPSAEKAPMPGGEMMDAGLTELADGETRAEEEGDDGDGAEFLGDLSPAAFMALLDAWWDAKSADITAKMGEIDNQLKGMGYERRMKEQASGLVTLGKKLDDALATLKELNGDAPEARKGRGGHRPSEDNDDLDALFEAALKAGGDDADELPGVPDELAPVVKFLTANPIQPAA